MFKLGRLSVDMFAADCGFPGKKISVCDQNFFDLLMLSLSAFL